MAPVVTGEVSSGTRVTSDNTFPSLGHRTQDTGHRTQDTGHRTQDTGHRTQDTGHRTQGTAHTWEIIGIQSPALTKSECTCSHNLFVSLVLTVSLEYKSYGNPKHCNRRSRFSYHWSGKRIASVATDRSYFGKWKCRFPTEFLGT